MSVKPIQKHVHILEITLLGAASVVCAIVDGNEPLQRYEGW